MCLFCYAVATYLDEVNSDRSVRVVDVRVAALRDARIENSGKSDELETDIIRTNAYINGREGDRATELGRTISKCQPRNKNGHLVP